MKRSRLWITIGIVALLAAAGEAVASRAQAAGGQGGGHGRAYIVTVTDSAGQFVSREVITLHADPLLSKIIL